MAKLHIGVILLLAGCLTACNNGKKPDETPAAKPEGLIQAENAFAAEDYRTAVSHLLPLAQEGNADAQYALGYALYEGLGVPQDRMQAYFWIQESAQQGNASALLALELFEPDPNLPLDNRQSIIEGQRSQPTFEDK